MKKSTLFTLMFVLTIFSLFSQSKVTNDSTGKLIVFFSPLPDSVFIPELSVEELNPGVKLELDTIRTGDYTINLTADNFPESASIWIRNNMVNVLKIDCIAHTLTHQVFYTNDTIPNTIEEFNELIEVCKDKEHVFAIVENMPQFQGGDLDNFRAYIQNNLRYPVLASEGSIQGRVFVRFVVNSMGYVIDVSVIRGVDPLMDAEAVKVVKSSPRWTPGVQRGENVCVSFIVPVSFVLN